MVGTILVSRESDHIILFFDDLIVPPRLETLRPLKLIHTFFPFFSRGDTTQYIGGLRPREFGQVPMLLVFLFS